MALAALAGMLGLAHLHGLQLSDNILTGPTSDDWLGTDELGRGVFSLLVAGAQTSMLVGLLAAASATVIGIAIGATAGFVGGKVDTAIMRLAEIFQVMPTFVLAAVIVAMAGPGTARVIAVIAILSWPQTARLMRGEVLRVKSLEYVDAARCLGIREGFILSREVVPNAITPVIAMGTLIIGQAILLEAALGFFGLTAPDTFSWGQVLNSGQHFFFQAWWLSVFPGAAIFITVLAFNVFGDAVNSAFNPRAEGYTK
ncbi:ABC transporter permease [Caballeronia sp. LjRoot34]|uniref:ABC transporter permease n=1 Tax=Caballeronia sp. LjRoot34 TaxID=3342325 RepID=UPI003ECC974C